MSAIAIRKASVEDAALLARLHAQCFEEAWDEAAFSTFLRAPFTFALLAGISGDWRAFILVRVAADEGEVLSLGTLPHARRSGFARSLVETGCVEAHGRGARRLFLEVRTDNHAALSLYKKAGFAVAGRRPSYYARAAGASADGMILSAALPL